MAMFRGFKPQGLQKIANRLGYQGSLDNFDNYLEQNPEKKRQMIVFEDAAKQMARGGVVKMREGGILPQPTNIPGVTTTDLTPLTNETPTIEEFSTQQALAPTLPMGGATGAVPSPPTSVPIICSCITGVSCGCVTAPTGIAPVCASVADASCNEGAPENAGT